MTSSPPSSSDPLSSLRSLLEASSVPVPDDGTLAALLAVESDNVGRAARLIIDDHRASQSQTSSAGPRSIATPQGSSGLRRRYQPLEFAENEEEYEAAVRGSRGSTTPDTGRPNGNGGVASLLYSVITLPFSALQSLLLGIIRLLRLPSLFASLFSSGGPTVFHDGNLSAAKQFAEEIAAITSTDGTSAGNLPPFLTGPYNEALRQARMDLKMLVVILTSGAKPEDDKAFLRNLTSPEVSSALSRPEYLVWGASVNRREGHMVARQFSAHSFPFLGCVALRAPPTRGYPTASPHLTLASRASGSALLSPSTLSQHLRDSYSRCSAYLEGLQAERIAQEMERRLMAEQDRAFEEASKRDAERVAKKREETKRAEGLKEAQRQEERRAEERLHKRAAWRRWAKHRLLSQSEPAVAGSGCTSIVAVLPDGRRLSRVFSEETPLEHIYAWIESSSVGDLVDGEDVESISQPTDYEHTYEFTLFLGYPRRKVGVEEIQKGSRICDVGGLCPRANIIVEGKVEGPSGQVEESSDSESSDGE